MVRGQKLDRLAERAAAEIGDRHLDALDRPRAVHVRVGAGHVVDVADHDFFGGLRRQWRQRQERGEDRDKTSAEIHFGFLPLGQA